MAFREGMYLIDWLASKIGVLIAIGVITTFVLGLFAWQHSAMVDNEGQALADSISGVLDNVGNMNAITRLNISYGNEPDQLPETIGGKEYSINISSNMVIITSGNRLWTSICVVPVIPQNLSQRSFNLTESKNLETAGSSGEHQSGNGFVVERARLDVSGEIKYVTLVYWE
jgi:hypothetical protein